MKKVLLTSLRSSFLDNDRVYFPMGLLYLASALKERGHKVDIEDDFNGERRRVKDYSVYDVVGISASTPQQEEARKVHKFLDENMPKTQMHMIGGAHATFYTDELFHDGWDYIVKGDGEEVVNEAVEGKTKKGVLEKFLSQARFDALPRPDRLGYREIVSEYKHTFHNPGIKATTFLSGRGCPMGCKFCEGANTPIRWTSHEKAVQELDDIQELGFNGVYVIDDLFTISTNKIDFYAKEFQKRNMIYRCNAHAKFMTHDFAKLLADTGCVEVGIGVESGSQRILNNVDKRIKVEQARNAISMLKKEGIRVRGFFMVGLPGETRETIAETERFIQASGLDDFQITVYAPYRGTAIRDAIDRGNKEMDLFVEGEPSAHTQKGGRGEAKIRTLALSSAEILAERDRLIRQYKPASHTILRTDSGYSKAKLIS